MKKTSPTKILVGAKGLDKFLLETLQFLLSSSQKNQFSLTTAQDESICIAQLKKTPDFLELKKYREEFPQRPVIVISKRKVKGKGIVVLPLPVTPRKIIDALEEAMKFMTQPMTAVEVVNIKSSSTTVSKKETVTEHQISSMKESQDHESPVN